MNRKIMAVALGVATVAGGGVLAHALSSPAKISLSDNSSHEHHGHGFRGDGFWSGGGHRWRHGSHGWFTTIDNQGDATFNQLLGINNRGQIAGYFGSGAAGHPNKGYMLDLAAGASGFQPKNFPGAIQTQVIGVNDRGVSVGFWSGQNMANMMNDNFAFYSRGGSYHSVSYPAMNNASPAVNQLLGINDRNMAVGFYTNGQGANRGYEYSIRTGRFHRVLIPGVRNLSSKVSLTASAINDRGDVAGFYSVSGGTTYSFLKTAHGHFFRLAWPGAASTQAFGINDQREVVGSYTMGSGTSAKTYGFTWSPATGFRVVNDPLGNGATTVNGVNDKGQLVGFYTDSAGNTDGFLWSRHHTMPFTPSPTVSPTMSPTMTPTVSPSMSATPTMSSTVKPSATPTTTSPAPTSSASPSGGPW